MNTVNIIKCGNYESENVKKAVYEALNGIDAIRLKITKGSRVLVKTNLVMRKSPEDAVTTHPMVVEAIVRYLQELGCKVIIGDSPGGPYAEWNLKAVYKAAGMFEVAERTGCELNFTYLRSLRYPILMLSGLRVCRSSRLQPTWISSYQWQK